MRKRSWFEIEIERGRGHVALTESRRTDQIGVEMASQDFYGGELTALSETHPEHSKIVKFFRTHFKTRYRHLLVNTDSGKEQKLGYRKSSVNEGTISHVVKLVEFELEDIAIVVPYAMEEKSYRKIFRNMAVNAGKAPDTVTIGSFPAIKGGEAKLVIFSIAKTGSMGFINTHGFWCLGTSRSKLSTIIVANNSALQESKSKAKSKREYQVWDHIVEHHKENGGYAL